LLLVKLVDCVLEPGLSLLRHILNRLGLLEFGLFLLIIFVHFFEHLDLHSIVDGKTHQRSHEWNGVGHAQCAEIVFASILPPGWDEMLLLEPLLLFTGEVNFPILEHLLVCQLGLGLG
jgi:hypothetical protein